VNWIFERSFAVGRNGIYFTRPDQTGIDYFDLKSRKSTRVADWPDPVNYGLSLSPDERGILYVVRNTSRSDLMMIENFR